MRLAKARAASSARDFERLQQAMGFTYNAHAMMFDPSLLQIVQPVEQYCHDFTHCVFVHGIFHIVV